jgi:hypothetical protein
VLSHKKNKEHDERIFNASNQILSERHLIDFLDELETDDSYFLHECRPLTAFCEFFRETGNQYKTRVLKEHSGELLKALRELVTFLARNFFVFPKGQEDRNFRLCLYPNLNIDRDGEGTPEEMAKYNKFQNELDKKCENARERYQEYRDAIKEKLFV